MVREAEYKDLDEREISVYDILEDSFLWEKIT